jgi:hypothetical protein
MMNTPVAQRFGYSYEEFAGHLRAMKMVRAWEDTSRFGHLGDAQTARAHCARVVEYFSDSYEDPKEAVFKADIFLSIYDYIGRNAARLSRKDLMETLEGGMLSVEPALLRAVHHVFTVAAQPASTDPKKVLALALALKAIEPAD